MCQGRSLFQCLFSTFSALFFFFFKSRMECSSVLWLENLIDGLLISVLEMLIDWLIGFIYIHQDGLERRLSLGFLQPMQSCHQYYMHTQAFETWFVVVDFTFATHFQSNGKRELEMVSSFQYYIIQGDNILFL